MAGKSFLNVPMGDMTAAKKSGTSGFMIGGGEMATGNFNEELFLANQSTNGTDE